MFTCFGVRLCVRSCPRLCSLKRPQMNAVICVTAVYATRLGIIRVRHGKSDQTGTHFVDRFLCSCFCRVCSLFTFINFQALAKTVRSDDIVCQTESTIPVVGMECCRKAHARGSVGLLCVGMRLALSGTARISLVTSYHCMRRLSTAPTNLFPGTWRILMLFTRIAH